MRHGRKIAKDTAPKKPTADDFIRNEKVAEMNVCGVDDFGDFLVSRCKKRIIVSTKNMSGTDNIQEGDDFALIQIEFSAPNSVTVSLTHTNGFNISGSLFRE